MTGATVTETLVRVNYSETDQMGVAYHARYLVWLDIARTEHLRQCGASYRELETAGLRLAVSEVAIRYRQPARFDDPIRVRCWVREVASRRVDVRLCRGARGRRPPAGHGDGRPAGPRCRDGADAPARPRFEPCSMPCPIPVGLGLTTEHARGCRVSIVVRSPVASSVISVHDVPLLDRRSVPLAAQEQSVVEQLAPVLAAEDARDFRPDLFRTRAGGARFAGAAHRRPRRGPHRRPPRHPAGRPAPRRSRLHRAGGRGVRARPAARHGGRSAADRPPDRPPGARRHHRRGGDHRAGQDRRAAGRASSSPACSGGKVVLSQDDRSPRSAQVLGESWRLGPDAPVTGLLPFMEDTAARAQAPCGLFARPASARPKRGIACSCALRDAGAVHPSLAARALTRGYAESAELALRPWPSCWCAPPTSPVRRSGSTPCGRSASYQDSTLASKLVPLLDDPLTDRSRSRRPRPWASSGDRRRPRAWRARVGGKGTTPLRRAALVALAHVDPDGFEQAAGSWRSSKDWLDRAAAAQGPRSRARARRRRSSPIATVGSSPPGCRRGPTR